MIPLFLYRYTDLYDRSPHERNILDVEYNYYITKISI